MLVFVFKTAPAALTLADDLHRVSTGYLTDYVLETSVAAGDDVHTVRLSVDHDLTVSATSAAPDVCAFAVAECGELAVERFLRWERS